jgi:hypothetical protein
MRLQMLVLLLPLLLLAPACPPPPAPLPPFDGGDGGIVIVDASVPDTGSDASMSVCQAACANLRALGCREGDAGNCVATCEHANGVLTDLHPKCLAGARTKAQARDCRSVDCP